MFKAEISDWIWLCVFAYIVFDGVARCIKAWKNRKEEE